MTRRRALAAAAGLLSAALLTSCAPEFDAGWSPPAWPSAPFRVVDEIISASVTGSVGIAPQRLRNDDVGIQARFTYLPGPTEQVSAFNAAVDGYVGAAVHERASAVGVDYHPHVFSPDSGMAARDCVEGSLTRPAAELLADPTLGPIGGTGTAVVCEVVFAAGSIFAERFRTVTGSPVAVEFDASTTLFADTATGVAGDGLDLWAEGAAGEIADAVIADLLRGAGALSLAPVADSEPDAVAFVQQALASTMPTAEGLAFELSAGFTASVLEAFDVLPTSELLVFAVTADAAGELLSDLGRAVATAGDGAYDGPAVGFAGFDHVNCTLVPCVALTYDDGPSAYTPGMLDELNARGGSATFFVLGHSVAPYADIVRRTAQEGHLVENHSWNHPSLPSLPDASIAAQVNDTNAAIEAVTGVPVRFFRPPYGAYNARVLEVAQLPAILWDVDIRDWDGLSAAGILAQAVAEARPGSILLQHDIHAATADSAAAVYDALLGKGFRLVNLVQLFGDDVPTSGAWRSAR